MPVSSVEPGMDTSIVACVRFLTLYLHLYSNFRYSIPDSCFFTKNLSPILISNDIQTNRVFFPLRAGQSKGISL